MIIVVVLIIGMSVRVIAGRYYGWMVQNSTTNILRINSLYYYLTSIINTTTTTIHSIILIKRLLIR